ncbi:phosphoenolpyruvate synthase [Solwaraspora sp. WMMD1047]|uniref:rifamycin-inactivating phosphotransferase n=1 Tax=Solwaraspora sp. WMMD1047 TaxID=3016102 RepID=UPI002417EB65|nr:rifamycin-inactivating phosphotransferase [Solwaraspora sp. WMMD1047]MDG4829822.1 phosphoenolpyruvate synthase [Solwaraspora sp. WMMD1047]
MSERYVWGLSEVDRTRVAEVGGKGAQLGELSRIDGVRVPPGFCVTTGAFRRVLAGTPALGDQVDRLSHLDVHDRPAIEVLSAEIRRTIEGAAVPGDVSAAISGALERLGGQAAYAVRSSATAEDLPTASFAGQHDSYLDVVGPAAVLRQVSRCWASLFTERAVTYRLRNGFDHRAVQLAVVVQRMVSPRAAGVLFTADPVSGNRRIAAVEASFGLGEALVAGRVNPDTFRVRDDEIVAAAVDPERPALTEEQVLRLVRLGRRIEAHFGHPQDIEWCLVDDDFQFVQSRPITTGFPVPEAGDDANHVYVSVGHQQMMTDPMRPLGISMWQLTAMAPMHEAGGRLFVDVTGRLTAPASRAALLAVMGRGDPLIRDALETILDRGDVIPTMPDPSPGGPPTSGPPTSGPPAGGAPGPIPTDPGIVDESVRRSQDSIAALRRDIATVTGPALFDFLLAAFEEQKRVLADPLSMQAIMAGMDATWWLNDTLYEWLGERNAADTLTLSAPGNITSQMGLALLDVADVIRPYPQVVAFLRNAADDGFLAELPKLPGGAEARDAIAGYLDRYGMRCVGEIDITRPRWSERPGTLLPVILDNVRLFAPGEAERRFERGRRAAARKERDVLARLRALPDGERKATEAKRMIDRVRTFIGYREYPKYGIVTRYLIYKRALLAEADRLVAADVLADREDSYYLSFQELHDVVRTGQVDHQLIGRRKEAFRSYHALTPPRVLTSDGEAVAGAYRRDDVPAGALVGLPVSAGTVEGRARVILDLARADLAAGDILVTAHTDPSWSPLFVAIAGLVTEVGGLMTHGAVIAREYGLPALVGVEHATRLIRDGQRIRLHATDGYVEILS